jgi:Cu/Zn superoxide dismutase
MRNLDTGRGGGYWVTSSDKSHCGTLGSLHSDHLGHRMTIFHKNITNIKPSQNIITTAPTRKNIPCNNPDGPLR